MRVNISPRKRKSGISRKIVSQGASQDVQPGVIRRQNVTAEKILPRRFHCVSINESDRSQFAVRMSPEFRRISEEIMNSNKTVTPSFEVTDRILMEATRKAFKTLGISH